MGKNVISGTFTGTGNSATSPIYGQYNYSLWGTWVGTVIIERSFDGGTTWIEIGSSTTNGDTHTQYEPERGVLYRLRCSAYTSGTINYRVGNDGL